MDYTPLRMLIDFIALVGFICAAILAPTTMATCMFGLLASGFFCLLGLAFGNSIDQARQEFEDLQ